MSNMSYCRFHNTLNAVEECQEVLEEFNEHDPNYDEGDSPHKLSKEEARAAVALVRVMAETLGVAAELVGHDGAADGLRDLLDDHLEGLLIALETRLPQDSY